MMHFLALLAGMTPFFLHLNFLQGRSYGWVDMYIQYLIVREIIWLGGSVPDSLGGPPWCSPGYRPPASTTACFSYKMCTIFYNLYNPSPPCGPGAPGRRTAGGPAGRRLQTDAGNNDDNDKKNKSNDHGTAHGCGVTMP